MKPVVYLEVVYLQGVWEGDLGRGELYVDVRDLYHRLVSYNQSIKQTI